MNPPDLTLARYQAHLVIPSDSASRTDSYAGPTPVCLSSEVAIVETDRDTLAAELQTARAERDALKSKLKWIAGNDENQLGLLLSDMTEEWQEMRKASAERDQLRAEIDKLSQRCGDDTARLDWLEGQHVQVRTPLVYGSRELFWAYSEMGEDGDDDKPSDLRAKIDAARGGSGA